MIPSRKMALETGLDEISATIEQLGAAMQPPLSRLPGRRAVPLYLELSTKDRDLIVRKQPNNQTKIATLVSPRSDSLYSIEANGIIEESQESDNGKRLFRSLSLLFTPDNVIAARSWIYDEQIDGVHYRESPSTEHRLFGGRILQPEIVRKGIATIRQRLFAANVAVVPVESNFTTETHGILLMSPDLAAEPDEGRERTFGYEG